MSVLVGVGLPVNRFEQVSSDDKQMSVAGGVQGLMSSAAWGVGPQVPCHVTYPMMHVRLPTNPRPRPPAYRHTPVKTLPPRDFFFPWWFFFFFQGSTFALSVFYPLDTARTRLQSKSCNLVSNFKTPFFKVDEKIQNQHWNGDYWLYSFCSSGSCETTVFRQNSGADSERGRIVSINISKNSFERWKL